MDDNTRVSFANADHDQLRVLYCSMHGSNMEESFVTRAISLYVNKYTHGIQKQDAMDLFQEVYIQIREKFSALVDKFRAQPEKRTQTYENFERWLHASIRNQLIDLLKSRSGRYSSFRTFSIPEPVTSDSLQDADRVMAIRRWEEEALGSLGVVERQELHARLVDNKPYKLLSSELEIPVKRLYKIHFQAILKFRAKMIQSVIERALVRSNGAVPIQHLRHLIDNRCKSQHTCYLYYLACPKAKDPSTLSEDFGGEVTSEQIVSYLKELSIFVQEALDDWELYVSLDRCLWASS